MASRLNLFIVFLLLSSKLWAQQPTENTVINASAIPEKFTTSLHKKINSVERQLQKSSAKALRKLQKQERKLYKAMLQQNSQAAQAILGIGIDSLAKEKLLAGDVSNTMEGFHPWVDSMRASLQFLQTDSGAKLCMPNALKQMPLVQAQLQKLQSQLAGADKLHAIIADRQQLMRQNFLHYPSIQKLLDKYTKQAYYYKAKLNDYKALLSNRKKAEAAAYHLLSKIPAFKKFISKHTYLGNLLSPSIGNVASYGQTNNYVIALVSSNGPGAMQQIRDNIQAGQNQLEQLKAKLGGAQLASGGNSNEIPTFKANEMRKKSFFKRLSFGTNYQFTAARGTAPQMLDLGVQVAYQFNKNKQAGIGLGYRLGMGKSIRQLALSSEGLSMRSFFDLRIKGGIYASGGLELQYNTRFYQLRQLQLREQWNQLALIGISKKMNLGKKAGAGISVQYNIFAHQQPASSPWVIRYHIGMK
jgi:ribosome-associated translation inhibitor RaiA